MIYFSKTANWFIEDSLGTNENKLIVDILSAPVINSNFNLLFNTLQNYANQNVKIFINSRK